jgi:hypothetical protein
MRCQYETTESHPGACDGGFQCPKSAVIFCDDCGQNFCPDHIRVCLDCGKVFCSAPMESRCYGDHAHDPEKIPPQPAETMYEQVLRVEAEIG